MAALLDSDASLTDESFEEKDVYLSDEDIESEKILLPKNVSTENFYMNCIAAIIMFCYHSQDRREECACFSSLQTDGHDLTGQELVCTGVYFDTIQKLKDEEHVKGTEKGHHVVSLTTYLEKHGGHIASKQFADFVLSRLSDILDKSKHKRKLPSGVMGKVWGQFHKFRFDSALHHEWMTYLSTVDVPPTLKIEASLTLQLLLDRLFKHLINILAIDCKPIVHPDQEITLTLREQNAVRYMAGYVAVKLKRKFWKKTKNPEIEKKRNMFVQILTSMEADHQEENVDSIEDYSTMWTSLIDRGGLYHIKDEVRY